MHAEHPESKLQKGIKRDEEVFLHPWPPVHLSGTFFARTPKPPFEPPAFICPPVILPYYPADSQPLLCIHIVPASYAGFHLALITHIPCLVMEMG